MVTFFRSRSLSLSLSLFCSAFIHLNLCEFKWVPYFNSSSEWVPPEDKRWIIFMANCTQWKLVPHFLEYTWCKLFWEHSKYSTFDSINLYGYANLRTGWALRSERNGKEIGYSGEILNWIFYLKNIHELAHSIEWAFVNSIWTKKIYFLLNRRHFERKKIFFPPFFKPFVFFSFSAHEIFQFRFELS